MVLLKNYRMREYMEDDSQNVFNFLLDILTNEFKIVLDFENLDSDLLHIQQHYNKDDGGCFWIVERYDKHQIIGTVAIRKLRYYMSDTTNLTTNSAELKRMFLSKPYRGLGIGQQMLDSVLDFAKKVGYFNILLYSS